MIARVRCRVSKVRLGKHIDWRYFAKRAPYAYRKEIESKRKNQQALKALHERLVNQGLIRA